MHVLVRYGRIWTHHKQKQMRSEAVINKTGKRISKAKRPETNQQAEGRPPEPNKTNKGATMADPKQSSREQGNTTTKKRTPALQTTTPLQ